MGLWQMIVGCCECFLQLSNVLPHFASLMSGFSSMQPQDPNLTGHICDSDAGWAHLHFLIRCIVAVCTQRCVQWAVIGDSSDSIGPRGICTYHMLWHRMPILVAFEGSEFLRSLCLHKDSILCNRVITTSQFKLIRKAFVEFYKLLGLSLWLLNDSIMYHIALIHDVDHCSVNSPPRPQQQR